MFQGFRLTGVIYRLVTLGLIACSFATQACGELPNTSQIKINHYPVTVELAVREEEKTCGLSFRDSLSKDHGMLFVYAKDRMMTFWMKDTHIPLSIAFLDGKGVILNILEMEPMDRMARYRSVEPARYALEMSANWFVEHHITAGDRIELHLARELD